MKNKTWAQSFKNAVSGVRYTIRTERNFKVHFVAAFFALCASRYLKVSETELLFVILAVALVFIAETFNTALENAVNNRAGDAIVPWAKASKDAAAGAVMLAAAFSVIVGLMVFIPKLADAGSWAPGAGRALLAAAVSGLAAYAGKKALSFWSAVVFSVSTALTLLTKNAQDAVFGYVLALLFAAWLAGGKNVRAVSVALGGLGGIVVTLAVFWVWR